MSLFDTLDGAFMTAAYEWAFARPLRKLTYNAVVTGLSVAVALLVGTIQLVSVLHDLIITAGIYSLVGFEVTPVIASSWMRRSRSPLRIMSRETKSSQGL